MKENKADEPSEKLCLSMMSVIHETGTEDLEEESIFNTSKVKISAYHRRNQTEDQPYRNKQHSTNCAFDDSGSDLKV